MIQYISYQIDKKHEDDDAQQDTKMSKTWLEGQLDMLGRGAISNPSLTDSNRMYTHEEVMKLLAHQKAAIEGSWIVQKLTLLLMAAYN